MTFSVIGRHFQGLRPALALALTGLAAAPAAAQTTSSTIPGLGNASQVIIPQSRSFPLRQAADLVEITGVEARIRIVEQTAATTLEVSLRNPSGRQAEAVLLLPVPTGAAVSGFMFEGAASEPTATLMPAEEARRTYDQIVARVKDPALLEFAGYTLVRSSVFPVPPSGTQKVRLTYEHLLLADGDRVDYVLPRSESLDRRVPWSVAVDIRSAEPISTVYSPSHELIVNRDGPSHLTARLASASKLEPGPFLLSTLMQRDGVSASLLAYPDPAIGGGYFMLMAGLPVDGEALSRTIHREVTLVIDRSGSMAGGKLDQVRDAALQIIEGLEEGEAFNIVDYATTASQFAPRAVRRDRRSLEEARAYLASIRPTGGTNIYDALLEALRPEPSEGTLPIVLFLTDGLPTVGKTSELAIRAMVEQGNPHRRRVFTFGVGHDVNAPLLDRLADLTRATSTYVQPEEDVEVKVAGVFQRLYGPVLAGLELRTLDTAGAESTRRLHELIPDPLPDLFDGDRLILLGQYRDEKPVTIELAGSAAGERRVFSFTFDLSRATTRNAFVPRLWASRRIALLVDQIRQAGAEYASGPAVTGSSPLDDPRFRELTDEILRLSTEFGILTEYTAFLATEGTDLSDWGNLQASCNDELDEKAIRTRSGQSAVNQSLNYWSQKDQAVRNFANRFVDAQMNAVEITSVQQVCDRSFFRRGQQWIDGRLVGNAGELEPDETVTFGSEAHVALLRELIGQGRQAVLSLDGEIFLQHEGRTILVRNRTP
ncbi:MAG: VIT domain-containing protein [Planctomycetota bacterium]|jgi:Ca-activated chloride channel family protein